MGGAFVAVADDATAVYWNPAGLVLGGSYFSLVLDANRSEAAPDDDRAGGRQSADIIAFSTLPVGLSYYRLSNSRLRPSSTIGSARLGSPHHSLRRRDRRPVAGRLRRNRLDAQVGTRLRGVRPLRSAGDRDDLLDGAGELPDHSTNKFDLDIGVMALLRTFRVGLTFRNLTEPDFSHRRRQSPDAQRQTRAGVSYLGVPGLNRGGRCRPRARSGRPRRREKCCHRCGSHPLATREPPQRVQVQHAWRRARRPRPGLQPWSIGRDLPLAPHRCPGNARREGRGPRLGDRGTSRLLGPPYR